jgi:uncharacterized membrane protein
MNIRNIRQLKQTASQRLAQAALAKNIVFLYGGISIGLSALVTVVNYFAGSEMSNFGGLSNIGIRSLLSTIQTVLPMIQSVVVMALEFGYLNAALRISREQYASPNSLRMGYQRFWPMLRLNLMQAFLYMGIMLLSCYLAIQLFFVTPFANEIMSIASGLVGAPDPLAMIDEATYAAISESIVPLFPMWGVIFLLLFLPIFYKFRMANYLLIDNPKMHTGMLLRESGRLMKGNRFALFRLDLSLWWYFLLTFLASAVGYGDVLLPMVGITLPWPETVSYFLFYGIYLVLELVLVYFFLNPISVTYALAYQSLCPKKEEESGVVLGNIFQM